MGSALNPFLLYNDMADPRLGATVYGAAPAADASGPAVNAMHRDPYTVWRFNGGSSPVLTVDLGQARAISGAGVAHFVPQTAGNSLPDITVSSSPDAITWQVQGMVLSSAYFNDDVKNWSQRFPADIVARYWRFAFGTPTNAFLLGKVYVGTFFSFINVPGGPEAGSSIVEIQHRSRARTISGIPIIDTNGRHRRVERWQLVSDDTVFDPVRDLARSGRPFLATDWIGDTFLAELASEDRVSFDAIWGLPNLWRIILDVEELP